MDSAVEDFGYLMVPFQSIGETFRTVIIAFFSGIFRIDGFFILFTYRLNKLPVTIQHTNSILNHYHTFAKAIHTRGGDDGLFIIQCPGK